MRRIAIVGASLAGVSAADSLRDRGFDGEITLLDAEASPPYDKPPLSKGALAGGRYETLPLRPQGWYEERGVNCRFGRRVVGLDTSARTLHIDDGRIVEYDGLVIASGCSARNLPVPYDGSARIHRLRTLDDSKRLRSDLAPGRHLVVVGAGLIGLEVAATARRLGVEVTVVENAATPLSRMFGPQVGEWFRQLHQRHGVEVRCSEALRKVTAVRGGARLEFAAGPPLSADVVLAGVGAVPQTGWLTGSGIALADGVLCASDLRTSAPNVVAAGDIVRWRNSLFGEVIRVEHWANAVEQGYHAAGTLLGAREDYRAVPYFWTDQHDAKVRFAGRAAAGDDIVLETPTPHTLVALFGRAGVLRGAVCVNAPARLIRYREAIRSRTPWNEAVRELRNDTSPPVHFPSPPGRSRRAPDLDAV